MCDKSSLGQSTLGAICVQTAGLHCSIPVANKGIRVKFNHIPNYSHWHDITAPHELCENAAQTDWLNLIPQPDFVIMVSPIQCHFCWLSLWAFHIQILECLVLSLWLSGCHMLRLFINWLDILVKLSCDSLLLNWFDVSYWSSIHNLCG